MTGLGNTVSGGKNLAQQHTPLYPNRKNSRRNGVRLIYFVHGLSPIDPTGTEAPKLRRAYTGRKLTRKRRERGEGKKNGDKGDYGSDGSPLYIDRCTMAHWIRRNAKTASQLATTIRRGFKGEDHRAFMAMESRASVLRRNKVSEALRSQRIGKGISLDTENAVSYAPGCPPPTIRQVAVCSNSRGVYLKCTPASVPGSQ